MENAGSLVSAGGKLVSQKEISYSSDNLSGHLIGWTGGESVIMAGEEGLLLDQGCLAVVPLAFYLNLNLRP